MLKKILTTILMILSLATATIAAEIPMDAKLDYNQGIDFYKLGMYERAIESFRSAIRTYPDYIDASFTNDLDKITIKDKTSMDVLKLCEEEL